MNVIELQEENRKLAIMYENLQRRCDETIDDLKKLLKKEICHSDFLIDKIDVCLQRNINLGKLGLPFDVVSQSNFEHAKAVHNSHVDIRELSFPWDAPE